MNSRTRRLVVPSVIAAAVGVSACGTASDEQADEQLDDATDVVVPDETLPRVTPLAMAFAQVAESSAYRAELAMGMSMDLGALGQSISFEADPSTPMMFIEVDADGEQYTRVDMAPMMSAMAGEIGGADVTELFGGDLSMETWQANDTMIMDLGGFGPLFTQTPGTAEMFPADVFSVDLARLGDSIGSDDVATALSGQAAPDPVEMADVLRTALGDAESVDGDPDRFAGQLTFGEYSQAFGQDPDAMLGGMDAAFEQMGGAAAMERLLEVFDSMTVDVEVALEDGAVDTIRFDVDMGALFAALPEIMGDQIPASELDAAEAMFADASFDMTMLMDYDIDPSVDVVMPTGDFVDGTDGFVDVFGEVFAN